MDDITVIGPDGARHTFPAGTSGDVINSTLGRHYQSGPAEQAAVASALRGGLDRGGQPLDTNRSQGRRLQTNAVDGFNQSLLGVVERSSDVDNDGFDFGDFFKTVEELFGRSTPLSNPATSASNRAERRRREDYAAAGAADPISNPLDFASFLAGQLIGGGVSPENWIGGGGGRVAGSGARVVFTNFARQAAEQAVIGAATDVVLQSSAVANDIQDEFSLMQLGTSALVAGTIGGGASLLPSGAPKAAPGRTADDLLKEALDAAEDTFSVPTHEGAIPPLPEPSRLGSLPAGATDVVRIEGGGALPGDVWDPALNAWVHRVDGPTTAEPTVTAGDPVSAQGPTDAPTGGSPGTDGPTPATLTSPPIEADGTIRLTHGSSTAGLSALDPNQGFSGASSAAERNNGSPAKNFFGIGEGQLGGYQREGQIGPHRYETTIPAERMYDADANPLNLPRESADASLSPAYQQAIKDAGFEGFWSAKAHPSGMIAATFDITPVTPIRTAEVAVEVAPDPNNGPLTARWNSLLPRERQGISRDVIQVAVGQALKDLGVAGQRRQVLGGYLDETNPAFIVTLDDPGRADEVAKYLGHVLDQDSMLVSSEVPTGTSAPTGVVTITPPPARAYESGFRSLYDKLRLILVDGEPIVSGHQSANGRMALYNFSDLDNETFATRVAEALDDTYDISLGEINTSFINRKDYGHGEVDGQPGQAPAGRSPAQGNVDNLRSQTAKQLEDLIAAAEARSAPRGRNQDIAQPVANRAPVAPEAPQATSGGNGGSTPPPRDGAGAAPPPEPPKGNGTGGWSDVDWGTRGSPERAEAAVKHLDFLQKVIKPEQVSAFLRALDAGLPAASEGTYVNMDWIDWSAFKGKPEETLGLQNLIADIFDDVFKSAGMKKQSHAETKRLANEMGVSLSDVAKTHADITGDGGVAARLHVLRNVFNASAADARVQMGALRDNLRKGAAADDIKALAEIIERTTILGAMDKSASGEVARALNARKALSKPAYIVNDLQEALDSLNGALNDPNGIDNPLDVGKVLDDLIRAYDSKGAGGLNRRVRKVRAMGVLSYINYLAVGNMLSAPISAFRNLVGTPMMGMGDLAARYIAAGVVAPTRKALLAMGGRTDRHVTAQDTLAMFQGAYDGMLPSLHLGLQAAIKGAPIFDNLSSSLLNNPQQVPYAMSKARLAKWQKDGFSFDTIFDIAGTGLFEVVRTVGFRPSAASDEFYKSLNRHAGIRSFAVREANYQASRQSTPAQVQRTYDETLKGIMDDPTAEAVLAAKERFEAGDVDLDTNYGPGSEGAQHQAILMGIDLRKAANDLAILQSFQNTGAVVRSIDQLLRRIPLFRTLSANFVNTPVQLLVAAFRDYNPVTAGPIIAMEALTTTGRARHAAFFRALKGEEDSLTAGTDAEMAIGKMATGALVMAALSGVWAAGNLVGAQVPEGDEYEGVRPNSIKLPGLGWTEFTGFAPAAMTMGLIADMGHLFRTAELTHDQQFSLAGAVGVAIRNQLQNLPVLQGLETVLTAASGKKVSGDDDGAAGRAMEQAKNDLLLIRVTPAGNLLKKITEDVDPVMRDARGFFEELQANLPGLSDNLTAQRDFMGRVRTRQDAASGALQLLKTSAPTGDELAQELHSFKSRIDEPWEPSLPSRFMDGFEMTAPELGRLTEIQGQLYRDRRTGRNMEEALRHLITTPAYIDAGRNHRPEMFSDVVSDYRRAGKAAAHNPRSPLYMREMVARIGPMRAARDASARGIDAPTAMRRRGQTYGLLPQDQEALSAALAQIN